MNIIEYAAKKCAETPHRRSYSRHYAVVSTKRGKIVGEGANNYLKTSPIAARASKKAGRPEKQCMCSELTALLKDRYRKGYKLTVVRLDSKNQLCYSEPCQTCKVVLQMFPNIKVVEYSV